MGSATPGRYARLMVEPGRGRDDERYARLQARLAPLFRDVFADPRAPRTVVVVPGISMDHELLAPIEGLQHYEERQLTMLMLLRLPNTRIVFVTSTPIDPVIIDYYLSLLPGIPHQQALRRLTLLSAYDGSNVSLTRKILERPRLLERIRSAIGDRAIAHLSCFNATYDERALALALEIPLYACDPALAELGGKSGSRTLFRAAGIELPAGAENLRDAADIAAALARLRAEQPTLTRAVVKLDHGASGEGNAVFRYEGAPDAARAGVAALEAWIRAELPGRLAYEGPAEHWEHYCAKFAQMQGIVEAWIEGEHKRSPSAQLRIVPTGELECISTHDQVLGGLTGQKFLGSTFPADAGYRLQIQEAARRVGEQLLARGALGRFAVDFVSVPLADGRWRNVAIEINLRKGGTTHTFQMLQYLTGGHYDAANGEFLTPSGEPRCYYATDNLQRPEYRRLIPEDLIDVAVEQGLHFDQTSLCGVAFNLIGALSEFGKLGVVSIDRTLDGARTRYGQTVAVLDTAAS
jgi:hypothetical protein